ncbi:hypothetical protein BDW62DRAFT_119781 [Aspergillus aurantiobrunneus]
MSDKVAVEEAPVGTTAKPTFWARVKAHFKKWWWAHLIAFVVIVLVIALPLVYVGYPNIAQDDIDDSTLTVESMQISEPAPNGFHLNQRQVIGSGSTFHPTIYSFDAEVSLLGSPPFATVRVPDVHGVDGFVVNIDQWLDLTDAEEFAAFSTAVMMNEEFDLNVYGEPRLKLGALPTIDIEYNKTVNMKGLNRLEGFEIESLTMETDREDGNNAVGTVFIPNPSVLRLSMGNLTLDVSSNGTALGQSFLNDLVLEPGDNRVPMLSYLNQTLLFSILGDLPDATILPLTIVGNSSVYNGQEIPYFTAALAANTLTVDLNLAEVL